MNYDSYINNRYSNDMLYRDIPVQITKLVKNYNFFTNLWCRGRTLADAWSHASGALYNLAPIFKLLSYVDAEHRAIQLRTTYDTYSAENTPRSYDMIVPDGASEGTITIWLKHIPKGTTFITDILAEAEETGNLQRVKCVELQLINDGRHFIRVYKSNTAVNSYTVLTNWVDNNLIQKLLLLIPVLIGWQYHSDKDIENADPKIAEHYILENAITEIFTNLYEFYKQDINLNTFKEHMQTIFAQIIELKQLDQLSFETFTHNFANTINKKLHGAVKNELDSLLSRIADAERNLESYYSKKQMLTKQLFLVEKALPEDVKPFIDALKSTKAIEVIDTDDYEIKIRVTAPLQFFDPSDFKRYQVNDRSYYRELLDSDRFGAPKDIAGAVFDKIFIKHEYKLLMQAIIVLKAETTSYTSDALSVYTCKYDYLGTESLHNATPNPHHYYFNCWDKTKQQIRKAVTDGNYDLIPTLIVNSVQTINVAENTSFHKLLAALTDKKWRNKVRLIQKDGTEINWEQAIKIEEANYKSLSEPVEELVETTEEVTETVEETTETATGVGNIELLRAALNAQTTQEYTQVVIEEGNATPEDLEI